MEEIKIKLSEQAAKAYRNADKAEQQRLEQMVNELIEYMLRKKTVDAFLEARKSLSEEAQANGLTPELLDRLLNER